MKKIVKRSLVLLAIVSLLALVGSNIWLISRVNALNLELSLKEDKKFGVTESDKIEPFSELDWKIKDLEGNDAVVETVISNLIKDDMLHLVNQYRLTSDSTCREINMRIGGKVSAMSLLSSSPSNVESSLKAYFDELIEVNSDSDYLVKDLEHVKYCLFNE